MAETGLTSAVIPIVTPQVPGMANLGVRNRVKPGLISEFILMAIGALTLKIKPAVSMKVNSKITSEVTSGVK